MPILTVTALANYIPLFGESVSEKTAIGNIFRFQYSQRREQLFDSSYSLMLEIKSTHTSSYELLSYDNIGSIFEFKYRDSIHNILGIAYADYSLINSISQFSYSNTLDVSIFRSFNYNDTAQIKSIYTTLYGNSLLLKNLYVISYEDTTINRALTSIGYEDGLLIHQHIILSYEDTTQIKGNIKFNYDNTSLLSKQMDLYYSDTTSNKNKIFYELSYDDTIFLSVIQQIGYADTTIFNTLNELSYADTTIIHSLTNQNYTDSSEFKAILNIGYSDRLPITTLLTFDYEGIDLAPIFCFNYGLLDMCSSLFTVGYRHEAENIHAFFDLFYSITDEDVYVVTGSSWIELNSRIININEISITADEGSAYYQCSVTIAKEKDFHYFKFDTYFILHLFNDEYHFVVDSKNLSRTIDDEGNLTTQMTIEGLSPIVRYTTPRATTITKIWDEPTKLSTFIEELIGHVDYQAVDDYVPAYRLAAENAAPLELARSTMESIGSLIESLPNGNIKIRPLWPIKISLLNNQTADYTLNDDYLFSMSESPENNDWRNQFRILDVETTVQDTLEFVADEEDDLAGTLYAYPSPWRDGLTLRHTRGTPIYLSTLTEELVEMTVNEDSEVEPEIIEFQEGQASTRYPMETILSFTWLAVNLGAVSFVAHTKQLTSSAGDGYSLAEIRYTTRRLKARTSSSEYTSAQYLLEEI